jgi:hypothetical protein
MKNLIINPLFLGVLFFLHVGLGTSVMAQTPSETISRPPLSKAVLTFDKSVHDFGDIFQGEKATYKYTFKNTGSDPLIIAKVVTTCGCTATEYSKEPIPPGGKGFIEATFNSAGKMGRQNKILSVLSNAQNHDVQITLTGTVLRSRPKTEAKPDESR